jgi:3D (Asp-Asp-Asp) domain-containing protein|tara:strand:+ start:1092 stop:1679 length:588 start_codon:yes stop_codon:yes gene_type:complete
MLYFKKKWRYLFMSVNEVLYNTIMKHWKTYLSFLSVLIANGYIWTVIFDNYQSFYMDNVNDLKSENYRLNKLVSEHKLEGLEVTVTMYHPVPYQTDSTPNILADGTRIRVHKASEYRFIAVSRNLLTRWGGWLDYGDFILLKGTNGKDGVYQVKDTMNPRWVNRIDILETPGTKPYRFDSAQIMRTNLDLVTHLN